MRRRVPGIHVVLLRLVGVLSLFIGALLFWLPIPLGAPLIAFGLAILVATSRAMRRWIRDVRSERPGLDQWLLRLEQFLPLAMARHLRKTRGRPLRTRTQQR
jgi:hypothetical protein